MKIASLQASEKTRKIREIGRLTHTLCGLYWQNIGDNNIFHGIQSNYVNSADVSPVNANFTVFP